MATKKNGSAKFTAWTATGMKLEMYGSINGCVLGLFDCVAKPSERAAIIAHLQKVHDKLVEAGR